MGLLYRALLRPLLDRLDAEQAHHLAVGLLRRAQRRRAGVALLHRLRGRVPQLPTTVAGVRFANPLGVAGGFDKDARVAAGLGHLGFGHVEVGTLTPRPQPGNPRPRVFRLPADAALVNRMGFPNAGVRAALPHLRRCRRQCPGLRLGVSLGKQKDTPLADALDDYRAVLRAARPHADYFAVNVSSPNTAGLRELQGGRLLHGLLAGLVEANRQEDGPPPPLFVKVAPDLTDGRLDAVLRAACDAGVAGVIAGNTTTSREGLVSAAAAEAGGLSGRPLRRRSTELVARIVRRAGDRLAVIGVGGVDDPDSLAEKLDAGAALVQVYTGLVYRGPALAGRLLRGLGGERPPAPPPA